MGSRGENTCGTLASKNTETTEMSVISGGVDSKYVLLDGQERNIERSLSEIENKDITLTNGFLIETVGNSKLDDTGNTSGTTDKDNL